MSNNPPGARRALLDRWIARIERAGRSGLPEARLRELAEGAAIDPKPLFTELERRGQVLPGDDGRWRSIRFSGAVVGTVRQLARGDALLLTGEAGEAGYLIPQRSLRGAREGDTVLVRERRQAGRRRRGGGELPRAAVDRILERRWKRVVGTVTHGGERRWLVPFDSKLDLEVEVIGGDDLLEDHYVVVDLLEPSAARSGPLLGRVSERLGAVERSGTDVEVVLRHYGIPDDFAPDVVAAAKALPDDPGEHEIGGREDLRDRLTVTIDGERARDFDDAISIERLADGGFSLGVHIADVSHYVAERSTLDLSAYERGTSVYFPDRAVPMLPESLSNGLCSLRPGVPRLTMTAWLEISPSGEVVARRFAETAISSDRRMTYDEVRRLLDEPAAGDREEYGAILDLLSAARDLMKILHAERRRSGSIDFDLPAGDVVLDGEGRPIGVQPGERTVAHRIIEECMIAANRAVAAELFGHEIPALYRVHESPRRQRLEELSASLANLGLELEGELENLHPSALQLVLEQVEGREEEPFVSTLVLRSMRQALYDLQPLGHYALAARHYTHFTSPIRRYPDLLVHRQLKRSLDAPEEEGMPLAERLVAIADHCSTTERRAERAARALVQWKLVRLLADRVGERFAGHITGVQPFGVFVQLDRYFVDGLLPIRALTDDYYVHDPVRHRLVGQERGATLSLADSVEVVLADADPQRRMLTFEPADRPPRRRESPSKARHNDPESRRRRRSSGPSRGTRGGRAGRRGRR